jgi:hypothetical protein
VFGDRTISNSSKNLNAKQNATAVGDLVASWVNNFASSEVSYGVPCNASIA